MAENQLDRIAKFDAMMSLPNWRQVENMRVLAYTEGSACPCCKQHVQLEKIELDKALCEKILSAYSQALYFGYDQTGDFFQVEDPDELKFCELLRLFDIVEHKGEMRDEQHVVIPGYYRFSDNGFAFCRRECGLPQFAVRYQGESLGHILGTPVFIDQILFDNVPGEYEKFLEVSWGEREPEVK